LGTGEWTLELARRAGAAVGEGHAAAHVQSSSPPRPEVKYQIEGSTDGGKTWKPVVKDWSIPRRGHEPKDFWSQSFCWGALALEGEKASKVRIRFKNDGGKGYARCEAHLVYRAASADATRVTFAWSDHRGERRASHMFAAGSHEKEATWAVPTGRGVRTRWGEFEPVAARWRRRRLVRSRLREAGPERPAPRSRPRPGSTEWCRRGGSPAAARTPARQLGLMGRCSTQPADQRD